jgi:hypothetical protein
MHAQREQQYLFCLFDSIGMAVFALFSLNWPGFCGSGGAGREENAIKINRYRA